MKGINEFMKQNRAQIPTRVKSLDGDIVPPDDFMLGYKYLLVLQGNDKVKSKFQPCENIDDVNYFLNMWAVDFNCHGKYAVYTMSHYDDRL